MFKRWCILGWFFINLKFRFDVEKKKCLNYKGKNTFASWLSPPPSLTSFPFVPGLLLKQILTLSIFIHTFCSHPLSSNFLHIFKRHLGKTVEGRMTSLGMLENCVSVCYLENIMWILRQRKAFEMQPRKNNCCIFQEFDSKNNQSCCFLYIFSVFKTDRSST